MFTASFEPQQLGGAKTHTVKSGVAHRAFDNDVEALRALRTFFDFLPMSNRGRCRNAAFWFLYADCGTFFLADLHREAPRRETNDPRDRSCDMLEGFVPTDPNVPYDMKVRREGTRTT